MFYISKFHPGAIIKYLLPHIKEYQGYDIRIKFAHIHTHNGHRLQTVTGFKYLCSVISNEGHSLRYSLAALLKLKLVWLTRVFCSASDMTDARPYHIYLSARL